MSNGIWDWTYGFAFFSLGVFCEKLRASGERTLAAESSAKPIKTIDSGDEFETIEHLEIVDVVELEATPSQPLIHRSTKTFVPQSDPPVHSVPPRVHQEQQQLTNEKHQVKNLPMTNSQIRRITQRNSPPDTQR